MTVDTLASPLDGRALALGVDYIHRTVAFKLTMLSVALISQFQLLYFACPTEIKQCNNVKFGSDS